MNRIELEMSDKVIQSLLNGISLVERQMQFAISVTPTSKRRELLTDANIRFMQMKGKVQAAFEEDK